MNKKKEERKIFLANPRGFCAGVDRAIEIVEIALVKFGSPIYVRHEIVHNNHVVNDLKNKGAIFIEELSEVPKGAVLIFSAHGVSKAVQKEAKERGFTIFDATCPLVSKVHVEVMKLAKEGFELLMIGHKNHPEVQGTMGQLKDGIILIENEEQAKKIIPKQTEKLAVVTQTTLSIDDTIGIKKILKTRFPKLREPKQQDICYATQNRQDAVKEMAENVNLIIIIGSKTSSNTNRLKELGDRLKIPSFMIDDSNELQDFWFENITNVGISAGASAPEILVQGVIEKIKAFSKISIYNLDTAKETIKFPLPKGLKI